MSKFAVTDKLFFQYLVHKRGYICEIHNRECPGIGPMHILPKGKYIKLRYDEVNVVLACWFNAHYPTHHDPDGDKAIFARKRICEIRGYATWDALLADLKLRDKLTARTPDLKMMNIIYRQELRSLT